MSESIYDGADDILANIHRAHAAHRTAYAPPLAEFKATREQLDQIRRTVPTEAAAGTLPIVRLLGIPVVVVDTEEESTLFTMTWEALVRRLGGRA